MYANYTFEQSRFKRDSVIMNQVSRKKATSKVEKDFYMLMNNSNFGNDCQNNIGNCNFKAIYVKVEEFPTYKNILRSISTILIKILPFLKL